MVKYDLEYFETTLKDAQESCFKKAPAIDSGDRKAFFNECKKFLDLHEKQQKAKSDSEIESLAAEQDKLMKACIKAGNKILKPLDLTENKSLISLAMKGTIITQASPEALAAFAKEDKKNSKAIGNLMKSDSLMQEMLTNGGAKDGKYGEALTIYNKLMAGIPEDEDEFTAVNKKLAMAVALELAAPLSEFDTPDIYVDPYKRYEHFAEAYKNGELDPSFPHFSVWELRHVVNCDAPNDQMKWGRDMLLTYAPHMTILTSEKLKYNFIIDTDVLVRNPVWPSSPKTYQHVISGGGKDKPNAWFARFILKAHGIPTWGCEQGGLEGFTRWTPEGWETFMDTTWDKCKWEGVKGSDFRGEVEARSKYTAQQYYNKLTLVECFAEVLDGRRGGKLAEEKTLLHPLKFWRSLSIIQRALIFQQEAKPGQFERTGKGGVKTRLEKYLEIYEVEQPEEKERVKDGTLIIPVTMHTFEDGETRIVDCFEGGMQFNFGVGPAKLEFEMPKKAKGKSKLSLEVCTVHMKQNPLLVSVNESEEKVSIEVPYTEGKWGKTKAVKVDVSPGDRVLFIREKGSLGLAIKNIKLS